MLVTCVGSAGDVHPFVAVGRALRARGHEVLFAANPHFAPVVRAAGLEFRAQGDAAALRADLHAPELMHPRQGHLAVWRHLLRVVPDSIETVERAIREFEPDLVLRHGLSHGVRQVARRHGVPCAVGMPTPGPWLSLADRVAAHGQLRGALVRRLDPALRALRKPFTALLIERQLRRTLERFGFAAEPDVLARDWQEGVLCLGLWSPHFRPPRPDDPPHSHVCGFPWFDGGEGAPGEAEALAAFLARGDAPLVFALGTTAVHHPGDFYACAAEACERLGRRGIMLGIAGAAPLLGGIAGPAAGLGIAGAAPLLSGGAVGAGSGRIAAFRYAPFSTLLPRACATVHHGGIGSTAQALRAGRPMLVVPHSLDQPANAARVRRLGVAAVLERRRMTGPRLAEALGRLLEDAATLDRARRLGEKLAAEDGAASAAELLGALLDPQPRAEQACSSSPCC